MAEKQSFSIAKMKGVCEGGDEDGGAKPTIRAVYNEYYKHNPKAKFCYYRGDRYSKKSCPVCNRRGTIRRNGRVEKLRRGG